MTPRSHFMRTSKSASCSARAFRSRLAWVGILTIGAVYLALGTASAAIQLSITAESTDGVALVSAKGNATIVVDEHDHPVVQIAATLLAADVQRVTDRRLVVTNAPVASTPLVIAGTLGKSTVIQKLVTEGRLKDVGALQGRWETTLMQIVEQPFPGVGRALVIVGSDRRGTAYGLMQLAEQIGVSPWYWWADVPVAHRDALSVKLAGAQTDSPAVKYRGIFINDEDWGLLPWAARTFDPDFKNIGPKTYEKVFELMLRLRLNYLWPAMHEVSKEFGLTPENYQLADQYAIVAGSSHCEPMLFNNVHWNERQLGRWNYSLNQSNIHSTWSNTVAARGQAEAVWTLGIRGIHDRGMQTPPGDRGGRIKLLEEVFRDQRELLNQGVSKEWGPIAQSFVPYKEVLPIYDAGLKVPDDVTLVWVDDNFGYIRRLSNPEERKRAGGAGVYWHLSYYGGPHSYTWLNTTAPALMWSEFHKAWENEARTIWVINVGDIKPMEIGIDYFSKLAWNPDGFPLGAQRQFLRAFAAENFGPSLGQPIAELLMDYYRLGTVRKPELMERRWALSLTAERAAQLEREYQELLAREQAIAAKVSQPALDAYTELVGFPARVLAQCGLIFLADRKIQETNNVAANEAKIASLRSDLEAQVGNYNTNLAGGKWNRMMPGTVTARNLLAWNSQVRWPWGEPTNQVAAVSATAISESGWRHAATASRQTTAGPARWSVVEGLGTSGRSLALKPASLASAWSETDATAPTLEYDFKSAAGDGEAWLEFLPAFRLVPGMKMRVAVWVDNQAPVVVEVPGSSGTEDENGRVRNQAVQDNFVRARVALPGLSAGPHTFNIRAIDPGVVIDRIHLPNQPPPNG
jgi:hypothetical protein